MTIYIVCGFTRKSKDWEEYNEKGRKLFYKNCNSEKVIAVATKDRWRWALNYICSQCRVKVENAFVIVHREDEKKGVNQQYYQKHGYYKIENNELKKICDDIENNELKKIWNDKEKEEIWNKVGPCIG